MADLNLDTGDFLWRWGEKCLSVAPLKDDRVYSGSPECIFPVLFRFIDDQYVDRFFQQGELLLSSFERCNNLTDQSRKDGNEGTGGLALTDGHTTIDMYMKVGMNPLMLCCSLSPESRDKCKHYKCCIRINDILGLVEEISRAIVSEGHLVIRNVMHGPCTYAGRQIFKKIPAPNMTMMKMMSFTRQGKVDFDYSVVDSFIKEVGGHKLYFSKSPDNRWENEYRVIWDCNRDSNLENLVVHIPGPERFCEKMTF